MRGGASHTQQTSSPPTATKRYVDRKEMEEMDGRMEKEKRGVDGERMRIKPMREGERASSALTNLPTQYAC